MYECRCTEARRCVCAGVRAGRACAISDFYPLLIRISSGLQSHEFQHAPERRMNTNTSSRGDYKTKRYAPFNAVYNEVYAVSGSGCGWYV